MKKKQSVFTEFGKVVNHVAYELGHFMLLCGLLSVGFFFWGISAAIHLVEPLAADAFFYLGTTFLVFWIMYLLSTIKPEVR